MKTNRETCEGRWLRPKKRDSVVYNYYNKKDGLIDLTRKSLRNLDN
jgi:hypothetical protein